MFRKSNLLSLWGQRLLCSSEWQLSSHIQVRFKFRELDIPKPGAGVGQQFRRTVHYPEKYTIKPIPTTNLGGRDPKTGRVVVGTLGGGIKYPYLWVDYVRWIPKGSPPLVERVLEIIVEPNRSGHIALVGHNDKLRYILATENMKKGDIITTSSELTRIAVRPNEGDAYPVGSLPIGCTICCVEMTPGRGGYFGRGAGTACKIQRKIGQQVVVLIPSKREISISQNCMAVVGRISNAIHSSIPIGSANRLRHLGYRPRSGLWQRKSGRHGRKIRRPPPLTDFTKPKRVRLAKTKLTLEEYPYHLE
jgi:large subunit ribosomal protein L2